MDWFFDFVLNKQEYLFYLGSIMIIVGIIKEMGYFDDFIGILTNMVSSKRGAVALTSAGTGILPIPGRVTVSAGILDTMAPQGDDEKSKQSRSKFGVIDYLSTHVYYLFSPLEKTIILPMGALGLTYMEMMSYMVWLLVPTLVFVISYIFFMVDEDDIIMPDSKPDIDWKRFLYGAVPLFGGIGVLAAGVGGHIVFPALALYYMFISDIFDWRKLDGYINWGLMFTLGVVLVLSNIAKSYSTEINDFLTSMSATGVSFETLAIVSGLAFLSSFMMGSSGKYAGIVALLATIFGVEYLIWFVAIEFAGYLISPTHKCTHIGRMYFGTPLKDYYEILGLWAGSMVLMGGINTVINTIGIVRWF